MDEARAVKVGSTPLTVGDLFHDLMKQEHRRYPTRLPRRFAL